MTPADNLGSGDPSMRRELPYAGDLFGEIYLAETMPASVEPIDRWSALTRFLPGLAIVAVAAGTAAWLAEHYGFPIILLGLLIGLSLNFVAREPATHAGLDLASRTCLRWGIVALGFQVTFAQVIAIGPWPFAALVAIMVLAFAAGVGGAAISGQSRYAGILAGGATAICGASAALALYGIIGRDRLSQAQFALTLVGVSLASALAMSLYPAIAGELGLTDSQAGFLIGASIHDVAQAIGGGFTYSDAAGAEATIIKLSRVAMLGPAMILVALWIGNSSSEVNRPAWRRIAIPWFIVGFVLLVAVNSTWAVPPDAQGAMMVASKTLLLLAVIATAMRSDMALIMQLGWRAATPVACATLTSFLAACCALYLGVTN
ncbi:putative sulfate exporter family transporter [Tsuneonella sp. YG55]|uniref:Sulfate exporter family transporter n=1 Tax=Tsuneonella litorea TaxID=2976475 RepID=A0A9X3A8M2_9SPHN|nr:putative sulfate exporter family transporter [Tsuneonella litorea]MCT2559606.1 putative sulfate exporter family transporter [Tsuneonella litorea]